MDNVNDRLYQLARMQIDMIKSALGKRYTFEDEPNNEAEIGYTTYGTLKTPTAIIVLRLSNHICSMKNWAGRYDLVQTNLSLDLWSLARARIRLL